MADFKDLTRNERAGAIALHLWPFHPVPDATISQPDRQMVIGVYPGVLAAGPGYSEEGRLEWIQITDGEVVSIARRAPGVKHTFDLRVLHRKGPRDK